MNPTITPEPSERCICSARAAAGLPKSVEDRIVQHRIALLLIVREA